MTEVFVEQPLASPGSANYFDTLYDDSIKKSLSKSSSLMFVFLVLGVII